LQSFSADSVSLEIFFGIATRGVFFFLVLLLDEFFFFLVLLLFVIVICNLLDFAVFQIFQSFRFCNLSDFAIFQILQSFRNYIRDSNETVSGMLCKTIK